MSFKSLAIRGALLALVGCALSGCLATTVAGAAIGTAGAVVGVAAKGAEAAAKGGAAVVGAVIP
jgi:hypothetical protein